MASVELINITKSYDNIQNAVENISLNINDGEFLVLVGPSGCGKTTLLNLIAGLEKLTSGDILIGGINSNNISPKDRNIAMIFQNYALYPHMTIFDNIAFPLKNKKVKSDIIKDKVNQVAKLLMIEDQLLKKPAQLSGGQKQRVAIGRAIIRKPTLFLMDEPLSNLDVSLRNQMRGELKELHKNLHTTIIYVTHDQVEALTLATKLVILNEGKIQQIGLPSEIFNSPANEFVALFVGTPRMNLFKECPVKEETISKKKYIIFFNKRIVFNDAKILDTTSVDIAVRPEDFEITTDTTEGVNLHVIYSEFLGSEYIFHCEGGTQSSLDNRIIITSHIWSDDNSKRDRIQIKPNFDKLHFFNKITKERIDLSYYLA
ncbi:MAG: ABC transporter ATP-binding protein [Acholeplasmataceae bacterium]|nr:ABC transporter ATP-binding protein [Acholeplasmataceae bacterium]